MRSRQRVAAGSACLAAALALAGCSTGSGGGSTAPSSTGGPVTLSVIGWKGGPSEPAKIKEINAAFEAAHPNIKIKYTYQPANDPYTQKLNASFLAGNAADVVMSNAPNAARWAKSGYLLDLSDQPWVSDLAAPAKPLATVSGKLFAQPSEMVGIGLYSNMKLLKAVGIDKAPATWPEFTAALSALKKAGSPGLALPNKTGWAVSAAINATAASQVFAKAPAWTEDQVAGKVTFAGDPNWKASVQRVLDLGSKGFIDFKSQLGVDDNQGAQDFKAGKSAMLLQGSWAMSDLGTSVQDLQFSPWPGGEAGTPPTATTAVGTMWTINAKSPNLDAAKEYLKFWASPQALAPYLEAEAAFSPFTSVPSPKVAGAEPFIEAVGAGHFFVLPENGWAGGASQTAQQKAVQALLLGQQSVDETLAAYDSAAKG